MNNERTKSSGFTLMELMIAIVIVGILAAIAYPSYQDHIIKTRRAAAATCLMELNQFMERYYTTNMSYVGAVLPQTSCSTDLADFYSFDFTGGVAPVANEFSLTATAQAVQADRKCGNLTVNQAGTKSVSVSGTEPSACF